METPNKDVLEVLKKLDETLSTLDKEVMDLDLKYDLDNIENNKEQALMFKEEYDSIIFKRKMIESESLAVPYLYPYLKVWMVTIRGRAENSFDDIERILESQGKDVSLCVEEISEYVGGNFRRSVLNYLNKYNFELHNYGATDSVWFLDYYCTEDEAKEVIDVFYKKFIKATARGFLTILRDTVDVNVDSKVFESFSGDSDGFLSFGE